MHSQRKQSQSIQLSAGAKHILHTAERLFAEEGLGAVSTRLIARESGQKNPSALHYYFGNRDGLIEAILGYRILPVNLSRLEKLYLLKQNEINLSVYQLVEIFVEPFARELLKPVEETYYISMLAQLYASHGGRELYTGNRERSRALHDITSLLVKALHPQPVNNIHLRLQLLGRQTIAAVAEWGDARRNGLINLDEKALQWRCKNLIDFLVGGLKHYEKH